MTLRHLTPAAYNHSPRRLAIRISLSGRRPRPKPARHMCHVTRPRCHTSSIGRATTTLIQIILKHQHCEWRRSISNPSIVRHHSFTILSRKIICRFCQPRSYGIRHRWISLCCAPSHKVSASSTSQDLLTPPRRGRRELNVNVAFRLSI